MPFKTCWTRRQTRLITGLPAAALLLAAALPLLAQAPTLTVAPVPTVRTQKGAVAVVTLRASLPQGYHANSNTPTDAYLIPLSLKWTGGPLRVDAVTYPKASLEKYAFSEKPLSVVTGEFILTTKFQVPADAPNGAAAQTGTLRFQACNDRMCFAPKAVPVSVAVEIQ